ncbi:hypothetical protein PHYBOEH_002354 [Phytophthora boehmeriae]|uniref:Elicitin n=1 Tax=Phytophthora boehmeriae TaxID=109152 RepID=A0A8T1V605_9STRA|nr:hypothetical protein PHYBOEH_002354 [Phytophthora boehmeriae]
MIDLLSKWDLSLRSMCGPLVRFKRTDGDDAKTYSCVTGGLPIVVGDDETEQMVTICANPTCKGVLEDLMDKDLPDCTIDFEATQLNVKTEFTNYATKCGVPTDRK